MFLCGEHADVCWRMLTYADVCCRYADVFEGGEVWLCGETYADVC